MASEEQILAPQFQLESVPASTNNESHDDGRGSPLPPLGSATTNQAQLDFSQNDHDPKFERHATFGSTESGTLDSTAKEFALQPQDVGFGAWSYVAAAFAMYIVVWGKT